MDTLEPLSDLHSESDFLFDAGVLDILKGRWVITLILRLGEHPKLRFGQLKTLVPQISQKMLTQTLKQMERDGFIIRKVYAAVPPKVEYKLTRLGTGFYTKIVALQVWAESQRTEIQEARWAYDHRHLLNPASPLGEVSDEF